MELGENTRFLKPSGSARPARLAADCFAHVSANDLVDPDSGLKVCGCALRLTDKAVLVQASIPNGLPLVDPQTVFAMPSAHVAKRWNAEGFPDELGKALLESGWFSSETWACDRGRFGQAHFPTLSKP